MLKELAKIYRNVLRKLGGGAILEDRLKSEPFPPYTQVLALGKAAAPMAATAGRYCGPPREGFVLTKEAHLLAPLRQSLLGFEAWEAGHPLPDQRSLLATQRLLAWVEEIRKPGHLLLLLSGGTSSLLELPAPPLTLSDLTALNTCLLASGMPIEKINVVRKHLSLVKGGQLGENLARRFRRVTQLVFSDVCGGDLNLVGSGPALADPSTLQEADELLGELEGIALPALLRKCRSALLETPKSLSLTAELLADHRTLALLARQELGENAGDYPQWRPVVGEDVRNLATEWARLASRLCSQGFQGTLVATGEPTVKLSPNASGRGGRCQELAVHFARAVAGSPGLALLAGSSDGTDGPTPYAGAHVDGHSWARMTADLGQERALSMLEHNDTSGLLEAAPGLLLDTGPTGHNLNDLFLLRIAGHC